MEVVLEVRAANSTRRLDLPGKSDVASRSIGRVSLRNVCGTEKRPSRIVTATESGKGRGEPAP